MRLAPLYAAGAVVCALVVQHAVQYNMLRARIGAGFLAKSACSGLFVAGRSFESLAQHELSLVPFVCSHTVDYNAKVVTASCLGTTAVARWYPQLGCNMAHPPETPVLRSPTKVATPQPRGLEDGGAGASIVETASTDGDGGREDGGAHAAADACAAAAVAAHFAGSNPNGAASAHTWAVVVRHGGAVVAEQYAETEGITSTTPLLGWSMTKTVVGALVGARIAEGRMALDDVVDTAAPQSREMSFLSAVGTP